LDVSNGFENPVRTPQLSAKFRQLGMARMAKISVQLQKPTLLIAVKL
jgi:hypothetical protein